MIHPVTIEVEMRDSNGQELNDPVYDYDNSKLIHVLQSHLQEEMGGILCMGHFYLPDFKTVYSRGRWVIQITCCCASQMHSLEERLKEIFPV
jgi:hypothetical protein